MSGKDDMRRYVPDLSTVLKETDPARIAERRRKALEDSALKDAGAELRRERAASSPPSEEMETSRGASAPSPWAGARAAEIDKAMLPSAMLPAAEPVEKPAVRSERPARKGLPLWVVWVMGVVVVAPVLTLVIGKSLRERGGAAPVASASASASASVMMNASASATASATSALSVPMPMSAPTATVAPNASTGAPDAGPGGTGAHGVPKGSTGPREDPYESVAPTPAKSATPSDTPPAPTATSDRWF